MLKKVIITFLAIFLLLFGIWGIFKVASSKKSIEFNRDQISKEHKNQENFSKKQYVTDDCIEEWKDYAKIVEEELKQASNIYEDENTKYIVKNENDYVTVYKVEENGDEILYKATNINTRYLTEEDLEIINNGIEIKGREELNRILEDFE